MKRTYFLVAGLLVMATISTTAQEKKTTPSPITFGIRAGVSLQNINGKDGNDNKLENKLVPRFQAGVNVELPLANEFYLQPGLMFVGKGTEFKSSSTNLNISYLEIPVNFLYKPVVGNGKLLLGFGPYVGFGIAGKLNPENGSSSDVNFENSISLVQAATGTYLRKTDIGANLLFGYELSNAFSVQLNAQLGLVKINPDIEGLNNNTQYKNTGFGLSVGYRF
jgi:Outer membrane protein beta-barrel domain